MVLYKNTPGTMKLLIVTLFMVSASLAQNSSTTTPPPPPPKDSSYMITGSRKIRPGQPLEAHVDIKKGTQPVEVTLSLWKHKYDITFTPIMLATTAGVIVNPREPTVIQLLVPQNIIDPREENRWKNFYKLKATGKGRDINFEQETDLQLEEKSFTIFIQTDKGIYKPGQTVKIRALAMKPQNLEVMKEAMDIYITDPKGNRVQQYLGYKSEETEQGVAQLSLQLSDRTLEGDWTILVKILGQEQSKTFTVDNYVLPKFETKVKIPPYGVSSDPVVQFTVSAAYTFGKPVTGSVDVRVQLPSYYWSDTNVEGFSLRGKLNKNGEFSSAVSTKQLLEYLQRRTSWAPTSLDWYQFEFSANVTEAATGQVQSGSSVIQFYSSAMNAEVLGISPNDFKPGLLYRLYVQVKKRDGTMFSPEELSEIKMYPNVTCEVPLTKEEQEERDAEYNSRVNNANSSDPEAAKIMPVMDYWYRPNTKTQILALDASVLTPSADGLISISFIVPDAALQVTITGKFNKPYETESVYRYLGKAASPSNTYIQILPPLDKLKVGQTISINVNCTEPVKEIMYQVFSKGFLLATNKVTSPSSAGSKMITLPITITQNMSPTINIIVYYIRDENFEVVADSVSLSVDGMFQNPPSMRYSKDKVKPGESVDLILTAPTDASFFVLSNDKSVELLKSGFDITLDMVRDSIAQFSYGDSPWTRYMFMCGWSSFGGSDASSVFQAAGVFILTDSDVYAKPIEQVVMAEMADKSNDPAPPPGASRGGFLEVEKVRTNFVETFIFEMVKMKSNSQTMSLTSPDTITSWKTNGFYVHPNYGLAVVEEPAVLTTFRDVFVSMSPPPTIIRNEHFCILASAFNYYSEPLPILLTFSNNDQIKNLYAKRDGNSVTMSAEDTSTTDYFPGVEPNQVVSSKFCFTPVVTGNVAIRVSALTTVQGLSDAMEQNIIVKPEGVARSVNYPSLVNLTTSSWTKDIKIQFPTGIVPDSQTITVNVAGNIMGNILANIDDLLRQPSGCGEQNMLNLAPAVFILNYLISTNTATPELLEEAKEYVVSGYMGEMTYEHQLNGGFSAFGESDPFASTWLTALVVRVFSGAAIVNDQNNNLLGIDMAPVITRSAKFIMSLQNANGSFTENGTVFHKDMQGGSAAGEALVAYTIIALAKASEYSKLNAADVADIRKSLNLAGQYLSSRLSFINDAYDICIATYAAHLIDLPSKNDFFAKMEQKAIIGDGMKNWERSKPAQQDPNVYMWGASTDSISLEATSYAYLTYALRGIDGIEGLPLIRWITSKRGSNGGFISTQDTIIAIEALTKASIMGYKAVDIPATVTVSYLDSEGKTQARDFKISKVNELLLHTWDIPYKNNAPSIITITGKTDNGQAGPSTILADVSIGFNMPGGTAPQSYELSHELKTVDTGFDLQITASAKSINETSMTIIEVENPPGFYAAIDELKRDKRINLVEFNSEQNLLILYFDSGVISKIPLTVTVAMKKSNDVLTKAQPRHIRCYDYYNPRSEQTITYTWEIGSFCNEASDVPICSFVGKV